MDEPTDVDWCDECAKKVRVDIIESKLDGSVRGHCSICGGLLWRSSTAIFKKAKLNRRMHPPKSSGALESWEHRTPHMFPIKFTSTLKR